jgi:hypothetical protein
MSEDERAQLAEMGEAIKTLTENLAIALKAIEGLVKYVQVKEGIPDA